MKILEQAYQELERKSIEEKYSHNLSNLFINIRDKLILNSEAEDANKAQYEIDFLNFNILANKLLFLYSGTNINGETFTYPSLEQFDNDKYIYLIERQKNAESASLKARYSHILWLSPKKKIEFAKCAIDNYLKLIKIREKQDTDFPEDNFGLKVLENIKNAFLLSISVKHKVEIVKKEVIRLVTKYNDISGSSISIRFQLINLMLEHKSLFEESDFTDTVEVCEQMILKSYPSNKHFVIDILNLIIRIQKKLKKETATIENRIAEMWLELSHEREDETNLVSIEFCKNALRIYKKLKEPIKVKELEKRFNELRNNITLSEIGHEIDLTELREGFKEYADKLTDNEPYVILTSLMNDKGLLPTIDEIEKLAKESVKNKFFAQFSTSTILDRNGNTAQYFNEKEESEYFELLQCYSYSLEITKTFLIREIIFSGIKKGKLNSNIFLSFLQKYSWLGKELEMSSTGGKPIPYCWLALIAPALNEYFANLEFYFRNHSNFPNFILCIDSLSLKIEGMLRDICEFKGITTFELKPDKKGRIISQEKDIHKLLYEPELAELIVQDDLLFFKFLLIEKAGYNLRHRVAHSLMTFNEYNLDLMNLLIIATLKLGKYNLTTKL
jgi:hypothetical protein